VEDIARVRSKVLWFSAGFSVGAAIGLIVAPKSGAEARRYIADRTGSGRALLASSGKDFLEKTRDLYQKGCELADEAAEMFDEGRRIVEG
jgi:gas vesicle protein